MTARSSARDRLAAWTQALEDYGYAVTFSWLGDTTFRIVAERPQSYGAPHVRIEVDETWHAGPDPLVTVQRTRDGAYLSAGRAHAQILEGDTGALRIDVGDPGKPTSLAIHIHPFGKENGVRLPQRAIPVPDQWVNAVEVIAAQCHP